MNRAKPFFVIIIATSMSACGPYYAWGSDETVEKKLLKLTPPGTPLPEFYEMAERRGWDVDRRNVAFVQAGHATLFDTSNAKRRCGGSGGAAVPAAVASYYSPFYTVVNTRWIFDGRQRLVKVCVRKEFDGL